MNESSSLSPSQLDAFEFLMDWKDDTPFLHLVDHSGLGKTTILRQFQRETGAAWLDVRPFVDEVGGSHPLAMEDAAWRVLLNAIETHPQLIVDDFHLFFAYASNGCSPSPRGSYYETMLKAVLLAAESHQCRIILGSSGETPSVFREKLWTTFISSFQVEDYRHLFRVHLQELADPIDFDEVYRFAPHLSCSKIAHLCHWLRRQPNINTSELLDFIQSQGMASNIDLSEVQEISLSDLHGVDEVVAALEENIILPLENLKLAAELGLTPKRGVMLAGPPGTGKTTVGRALARRLRGKFFLIDGTFISGTEYFYHRVDSVFRSAIANAPSIVFVDDSDVIFESGKEHGLYRYLLTMLDGLESNSASSVCVIMTAMDLGNIPPALVRSGRIELWLEMKLPDRPSRQKLMIALMKEHVRVEGEDAWNTIMDATEGFSGADLKRLVQDAKLKLAVDRHKQNTEMPFEHYLCAAARTIEVSRVEYANSAQRAIEVNANRPRWFSIHPELFGK